MPSASRIPHPASRTIYTLITHFLSTDRPTQPPTPTNIRYLVESCLLHRINTATVAVILIRAEQLACADLRALCREFMMTLEVDALMSVFTDNLELAREEDSDAALLPAQTVAEVRVLALCFVMCAVCCVLCAVWVVVCGCGLRFVLCALCFVLCVCKCVCVC